MRLSAFSSPFRSPVLKLHERSESQMNGIPGIVVREIDPGSGGAAFRRLDESGRIEKPGQEQTFSV